MTDDLDVMNELAMADPLRHVGAAGAGSPERMAGIRRIVDARLTGASRPVGVSGSVPATAAAPHRRRVSRRWLALAGAATALAVVGTVGLSLVAPDAGPSLALTSVALGKDGALRCNPPTGYAEFVDPADSPVRLLPTWLPEGWSVGHVWAMAQTDSTCYQFPSLTMVDTRPDGQVARSAMVYGPISVPIELGDEAEVVGEVTIDGWPGRVIRQGSPKGDDELVWVWTDAAGANWLMRSYGYTERAGRQLAAALRPDGTQIGLDTASAPAGTVVVQQRSGAPYPARTTTDQWTITLGRAPMSGREGEVTLQATSTPDGTLGIDGVFPGQYVTGTGDSLQVREDAYGGMHLYLPRPGLAIGFVPDGITTVEPSLGSMTPEQWEWVVASLQPVASDDPRLDQLALDE